MAHIAGEKAPHYCAVCNKPSTSRCSKCKEVHYCGRDHQATHWREGHKRACMGVKKAAGRPGAAVPRAAVREGPRLGAMSAAEKKAGVFTAAMTYESIPLSGGESLQCGVILPEGFDPQATYPVCIAISGEKQMHVSRFFQAWHSNKRGWIVISPLRPPASPLFFKAGGISSVHALALSLLDIYNVEGGKFHMVGTSNGGSTCFAFGCRWPEMCHSITPVTGANLRQDDLRRLQGVPVDMFVGDRDELGFHPAMEEIFKELKRVRHKPEPTLTVLPGAGHLNIGQHVAMEEFWNLMECRRETKLTTTPANNSTVLRAESKEATNATEVSR